MTIGHLTIDEGEEVLIFNLQGVSRVVAGPRRIFLWREKYRVLRYHSATQTQYLRIEHCDGSLEHKKGPTGVFNNPLLYSKVSVHDSMALDANEVVVVYRQTPERVERRLVYGPIQFFPAANEWMHEFSWHGTDEKNKTRKIPDALRFKKLRIIPDQFYYNVDEVRTNDDAVITVKLMIFFELRDVELMLAQTADPIADFINALCADIVAFSSQLGYEEFLEQTSRLNSLDAYKVLMERSKRMGYDVNKVVFRGYHAGERLQGMHDKALNRRTQFQLQMESAEQEQEMRDLKLKSELERTEVQQKLQLDKLTHEQKLKLESTEHDIKIAALETEETVRQFKATKTAAREAEKQTDAQTLAHLAQLRDAGVDVTEYLLSQIPKADRTMKIIGDNMTGANIHLHPTPGARV